VVGGLTAPSPCLVEKLRIRSQKDIKQQAEVKEIAYKEGFYSGVMLASVVVIFDHSSARVGIIYFIRKYSIIYNG
jgi:hypothetical protein